MTPPIRTLLAEDEPPARRRLRALIERADGLTLVGECGDGRTAVELIRRERPDLVFLDVAMPELSGIEVVEAVGAEHAPAVIFVTAYDEHAVRAFDLAAVDYLLKPFDEERFQRALARAKERLRRPPDPAALLRLLEGRAARPGPERLPVRTRDRIRMVPLADVDYIEAVGAYVRVHAGAESHLVRERIGALEARLDPARFARLHRSLIVNVERVRELEPLYRGEYVLWLKDGTRLTTGRSYRERVRELFGL